MHVGRKSGCHDERLWEERFSTSTQRKQRRSGVCIILRSKVKQEQRHASRPKVLSRFGGANKPKLQVQGMVGQANDGPVLYAAWHLNGTSFTAIFGGVQYASRCLILPV